MRVHSLVCRYAKPFQGLLALVLLLAGLAAGADTPSTDIAYRELLQRGEAQRMRGQLGDAIRDLGQALRLAEQAADPRRAAQALGALGQAQQQSGLSPAAEANLRESLAAALRLQWPALASADALRLGNLALSQGRRQAAREYFEQALEYGEQAAASPSIVAALLSLARVAPTPQDAAEHLTRAWRVVSPLAASFKRLYLLVALGYQAQRLDLPHLAYPALQAALRQDGGEAYPRLLSEAYGYLGALYESAGDYSVADTLTQRAIALAAPLLAHDLLIDWEWQTARIARATQAFEAAIRALRRAVAHLEAIRPDIPLVYHDGRSSFRETYQPIYLSLAALLLQRAGGATDANAAQADLRAARQTIEKLKAVELQDYFRDACAVSPSEDLQRLPPGAAVLYPIVFNDRLVLLLGIGDQLFHQAAPVSVQGLEQGVAELSDALWLMAQGAQSAFPFARAKDLYDWLLGPFDALLGEARVDTIVYVPDGDLRQLPLSLLWDGEQFLIEKYAVATEPGLSLLPAKAERGAERRMLLAGLSEPGPVVDEYLRLLRGQAPSEPARAAQARGLVGVPLREITSEEVAVDEEQALTEQLRADLALPGVDDELASLSAVMPAYTLRNAEFVLAHLRAEIRKGYSLVHIATHGHFAGDPENSFIMTYDRFLTMNELARVLQAEAYAHDPLELLTLSACQTAQGDERSPLGLSGVAVQSGARSALGSLWPVSDEATQRLLTRFYAHLSEGRLNKAQSLRQAQLELLREEAFAHPFFWSPFVLIGDWR